MRDDRPMIIFYYEDILNKEKEPQRIFSFRVDDFDTWMKMLITCWKNEIEFWVRDDDESIPEEIRKEVCCFGLNIKDVSVRVGSDTCIQCIDVVI